MKIIIKIASISLFVFFCFSCTTNPEIKNITKKAKLNYYNNKSDSIEFLINEIKIIDHYRNNEVCLSVEETPFFTVELTIKNKTNNTINILDENNISDFVGIIKHHYDTIPLFLICCLGEINIYLLPKESSIFTFSSDIFKSVFNYSRNFDNTDFMLNLLKDIEFYYIPDKNFVKNINSDTIILSNKIHIGISPETKVFSKIYK
ncbi:MAG: hypothetical protein LBV69_01110 [Bacteroidales bacterium]|jgi:hypothetical protein|nr:hypothetical protein [Bacteroidales bacterium]